MKAALAHLSVMQSNIIALLPAWIKLCQRGVNQIENVACGVVLYLLFTFHFTI